MKTAARIQGALFLFIVISFLFTSIPETLAGDKAQKVFVDYDGDGFNDNVSDGDGIPTRVEISTAPESNTAEAVSTGMFDLAGGNVTLIDIEISNSVAFGARQFAVRSLIRNRCSLSSDNGFGSGSEIGLSAMTGELVCEGGICHPR
ncbi:MAG: hypothetical protein NTV06_05845 [candidate division Zixibacteria bacterium]|nr:hypothetical protein [candidate division Zixibacteria bacterium]